MYVPQTVMLECVHSCMSLWRPAESTGSPGTEVTGSFEPPDVGAGN